MPRWLNLPGLLVIAAVIAGWQLTVGLGIVDLEYLPSPVDIAGGLRDVAESGDLFTALGHTVLAVLEALAIAIAAGAALGLAIGLVDRFWEWSMATVDALRSVPGTALVPATIVIFGLTSRAEIASAVFAAIWPVAVNTAGAVRQVHPRLRDSAATLRLGRVDTIRKVVIPAAAPVILVGVRIGATITLVVVIVTEMIGNPEGVGFELVSAQQGLQTDQMWAWVVIISVLGAALNGLLVLASHRAGGQR
jgi:NitT/TauT family transport system permease protein